LRLRNTIRTRPAKIPLLRIVRPVLNVDDALSAPGFGRADEPHKVPLIARDTAARRVNDRGVCSRIVPTPNAAVTGCVMRPALPMRDTNRASLSVTMLSMMLRKVTENQGTNSGEYR
jgi:hypothetical protein